MLRLKFLRGDELEVLFGSATEMIEVTMTRKRWEELGAPLHLDLLLRAL